MEEIIQPSTICTHSLPPVDVVDRRDEPNSLECSVIAGRLSSSKGEPPPPYSDSAKRCQTDLPFSDPPKYEERQLSPTHAEMTVDKPFDVNFKYITSKQAYFKYAELILCIIGLSSCASFKRSESGDIHSDLTAFFLFLMLSCALFIIAVMWLNFISCFVHFPSKANHMNMAVFHIITGIFLLSGSLAIISMVGREFCARNSELQKECILLWISFVSGFLAALIFWLDAAIQMSKAIHIQH